MKLARYAVNGAIHVGRINHAETAIAPIPGVKEMFDAIERIDEIRASGGGDAQARPLT